MFKIAILLQEYKPDFGLVFMDIKMEKANGLKADEEQAPPPTSR